MERFKAEQEIEGVELFEVECCALSHAFAKNSEALGRLLEIEDKEKLKNSANILLRSKHIIFPHDDEIELAYAQMASAELERLSHEPPMFHCKHGLEEHKKALASVIEKTSAVAN